MDDEDAIGDLTEVVAVFYGMSAEDVTSSRRQRQVHRARCLGREPIETKRLSVLDTLGTVVSIGFESGPPSARHRAKPFGASLRYGPTALALQSHNLKGGRLFEADPGQQFEAV